MGSDAPKASGPDLSAGVPSDSLKEGVPLAGHVGEDAVLLTRIEGQCHAIGATCSHYGGPLAEGLVVGTTVRCPWHHAAFDLRTGAVDRPPALASLPCYHVEEENGVVRVGARSSPDVWVQSPPAAPRSIVIVGAGAVGVTAVLTLRKSHGYQGELTVIDNDPNIAVDRPNLSKDYLAGNAPEEWVTLRSEEQLGELATVLRSRVVSIDVAHRNVTLETGATVAWDALLLATGATPIRLPIPTAPELPLMTLRSLADSRAIIRAALAAPNKRAVVIGASFIGLEVAASLVARGLEVHVVAPEARPLERILGPEVGDWVRARHESKGVTFHLGRKPTSTRADGVILDDGTVIAADLVVAGVGVRPNVELAEAAGLTVDKGVVVDKHLATSAAGVWAAGDIARWPDIHTGENIRVEHWVLAQRQAVVAASNMLGAGVPFDGVPFFWSAHYDATIGYSGHAERWDTIEIDGSLAADDAEVRYISAGRVLATATIGRDKALLDAERSQERRDGSSDEPVMMLF